MNIRKVLAICVLAFVPALAMSLPILSMPTDSTGGPTGPLRHNLFHDASVGSGVGGATLAWFDLGGPSSWDPNSGALNLQINIFDTPGGNLIGTGLGTSSSLVGSGFDGSFNNASLGFIAWTFADAGIGGATALLGAGFTQQFINHSYSADSAGNLANTYVGNTVTLWGADGTSLGNGLFSGATYGVDMVFVVPEPAIILLMAMGLLGIGAAARRR